MTVNSSSIPTERFDAYRQGVSMKTDRHRFVTMQPKIWAGTLTHQPPVLTYGVAGLSDAYEPHDDTNLNYNINLAIEHIKSASFGAANGTLTDYFGTLGDSDRNIESFDGVIEPLEIRSTIPQLNLLSRNHRVSAGNATGQEGEPVTQYYSLLTDYEAQPYIESSSHQLLPTNEYTASNSALTGTVVRRASIGVVPKQDPILISPFDETIVGTRSVPAELLKSVTFNADYSNGGYGPDRSLLISALVQLSGSTESELYEHRRMTGTGFQYHGRRSAPESLAFGGLQAFSWAQRPRESDTVINYQFYNTFYQFTSTTQRAWSWYDNSDSSTNANASSLLIPEDIEISMVTLTVEAASIDVTSITISEATAGTLYTTSGWTTVGTYYFFSEEFTPITVSAGSQLAVFTDGTSGNGVSFWGTLRYKVL